MDNTCTNNLIGISQNECDCFTDELNNISPPDANWYRRSTSGLYLDELEAEGLVPMRASEGVLTCDKTLGRFYKEAITTALKQASDDAYIFVSERFKSRRKTFSGRIGGNVFDRGLNIPGAAIAGVLLTPFPIVDGVFKLTALNIGSKVTRNDLTISIYRSYPGLQHIEPELIQNIEGVTTVANRSTTKTFADPIELPLEVDGNPVEYMFIYEMQPGEELVNSSTSCGCGKKEALFKEYSGFVGITINADAPDMSYFNRTTSYGYGISLEGSFTCMGESIVCRMFDASNSWGKVFAYAVRYLAGAIVNEKVYKSPDISRWNMVNYDDVKATAFNFRGEYADRLKWLAQNADPSVNDCYVCNTSTMRKQGILS